MQSNPALENTDEAPAAASAIESTPVQKAAGSLPDTDIAQVIETEGQLQPQAPPIVEDEHITRFRWQGKEFVLIGTAHVSPESAALVKRVIETEHPDSVCIELDEGRYKSIQNPDDYLNTNISDIIRQKRVGMVLANLALSSYQKRMAGKLGAKVGGEMLQGIESAEAVGATLVLADRSIQTTLLRAWRKLTGREKMKLLAGLFMGDDDEEITEDDLQKLMQKDELEGMLGELHEEFPQIGEVLLNERDRFLAAKISEAPGEKVVAVLGGAHVAGVARAIRRPKTVSLDEINTVPKAKPTAKIIGWAIPIIIVAFIVYGFATNLQTGLAQLGSWLVWNGGLAALFTLIGGGHPLTILTSLVLAPFTSLNPLVAVGWFAGLVEASLRKPTVADLQSLTTDITSLKGIYHNRFLRTLLIVILANIGSSIGTIVAGLQVAQMAL